MALDPRDVQYLPVDASISAPLPRSKNYMIMRVPGVENVSDPEQSIYHGTAGASEEPILIRRIAIGEGADPKRDIFRDSFFSRYIFCTDELAVRVLQRRCSGIRFVDPWCLTYPIRFRSLRGIGDECEDAEQELSDALSGATEADRVADNNPLAGGNGIYAGYRDYIRGVQFAGVPIPMSPLEIIGAHPAKLVKLADQSLRSDAGEIITAAQLLQALDQNNERDAVWSAMAKFQLHPKWAAHILAARAYVWANNFAPYNFADVPASGSSLESVSTSIMQLELARPGTLYLALRGDLRSTSYVRMAAEEGLRDPAIVESWPADAPAALRSTRTSARAALNL